jgi:putative oxidoreductase
MFENAPSVERRNSLADWIFRGGVGVAFIAIGWGKFDSGTEWVTLFRQIGLGQWFRFFTGVVEMLGGVLALWPRTAGVGLLLLAITMFAAALVHIFLLGHALHALAPGALCFILLALWFDRRAN